MRWRRSKSRYVLTKHAGERSHHLQKFACYMYLLQLLVGSVLQTTNLPCLQRNQRGKARSNPSAMLTNPPPASLALNGAKRPKSNATLTPLGASARASRRDVRDQSNQRGSLCRIAGSFSYSSKNYFPGTGLARYALEVRGYHAGGTLASPLTPLGSFSNAQKAYLGYDTIIFGVGGSAAAYNVYDTYFDGE